MNASYVIFALTEQPTNQPDKNLHKLTDPPYHSLP